MIAEVIYQILKGDYDVWQLTGGDIYPVIAPQETKTPFLTYNEISQVPNRNKDRETSVMTSRIQIDCYAASNTAVYDLADKVKQALTHQSGTFADQNVDIILFQDQNDLFEGKPEIFRIQQDYLIRIKP